MRKLIYIIPLLWLCSCTNLDMVGMFYGQSPRSDERFADSMDYDEQNSTVATLGRGELGSFSFSNDDYKVYFATDMHVDSTWRNTTLWAKEAENDAQCALAIALGDLVNARDNFPKVTSAIKDNLTKPVFATVGNHDLYWGQWTDFKKCWGSSSYYFIVTTPTTKDLYICMDSGDGTWGRDQLNWLKEVLEASDSKSFRHKIIFTHTHLFKRDQSQGHTSNYALEETYDIMDLLGKHAVDWYVSGHDHSREVTDMKGVRYIIVDSLQDPYPDAGYMIATVGKRLQYEFVDIK